MINVINGNPCHRATILKVSISIEGGSSKKRIVTIEYEDGEDTTLGNVALRLAYCGFIESSDELRFVEK
jgi:hypothetical protein